MRYIIFTNFRADSDFVKEVVKPFDWTFTTDYKGTVFGKEGAQMHVSTLNMYKLEISVLSLHYGSSQMFWVEMLLSHVSQFICFQWWSKDIYNMHSKEI